MAFSLRAWGGTPLHVLLETLQNYFCPAYWFAMQKVVTLRLIGISPIMTFWKNKKRYAYLLRVETWETSTEQEWHSGSHAMAWAAIVTSAHRLSQGLHSKTWHCSSTLCVLISLLKELQVEQHQPIEPLRYENEILDYYSCCPYRIMFLWTIQRRKGTRNGS